MNNLRTEIELMLKTLGKKVNYREKDLDRGFSEVNLFTLYPCFFQLEHRKQNNYQILWSVTSSRPLTLSTREYLWHLNKKIIKSRQVSRY